MSSGSRESPTFDMGPCVSPKIYSFGPSRESYACSSSRPTRRGTSRHYAVPRTGRLITTRRFAAILSGPSGITACDHGVVRVRSRTRTGRSSASSTVRAPRPAPTRVARRRRPTAGSLPARTLLDVRDRSGREWLVGGDAIVHGRSERDADTVAESVADHRRRVRRRHRARHRRRPAARRPTAPTCRSPISRPSSHRSPSRAARATRQRPPRSRRTSCTPTSVT